MTEPVATHTLRWGDHSLKLGELPFPRRMIQVQQESTVASTPTEA